MICVDIHAPTVLFQCFHHIYCSLSVQHAAQHEQAAAVVTDDG